jgi:hypothetical protein
MTSRTPEPAQVRRQRRALAFSTPQQEKNAPVQAPVRGPDQVGHVVGCEWPPTAHCI